MQPDATTVNEIRDACQKHEFRTASLHANASRLELLACVLYAHTPTLSTRKNNDKITNCGHAVECLWRTEKIR